MITGLLSKGITLSYKKDGEYTEIDGLQSIPDIGGPADKVDVTTLADGNYRYINGIKDFGDLEFGFLYDIENYKIVRGLEDDGEPVDFKVEFPDGASFAFSGEVSTTIDAQEVNSAITFTMNITLNSDIVFDEA